MKSRLIYILWLVTISFFGHGLFFSIELRKDLVPFIWMLSQTIIGAAIFLPPKPTLVKVLISAFVVSNCAGFLYLLWKIYLVFGSDALTREWLIKQLGG
jgi:hypothetical protein